MRKWIIALAILMAVPAVGAAATLYVAGPTQEQLVEGHTVFTVIQNYGATCPSGPSSCPNKTAAAVAVLVREVAQPASYARFPGVLWFNDQYLVNPDSHNPACSGDAVSGALSDVGGSGLGDAYTSATDGYSSVCSTNGYRYPCSGAVFAVNSGDPDPRASTTLTYVESYLVTDPNDHSWYVDKWDTATGGPYAWTTALLNNQAGYGTNDDGTSSCAPYVDGVCSGGECQGGIDGTSGSGPAQLFPYASNPGDNGRGYPCDSCSALVYNAVLFMWTDDLTSTGAPKNHTAGSADYNGDVSGCSDPNWPCPGGNDNREGNSHPYTPSRTVGANRVEYPYPLETYAGRGNHGGSADCNGDGTFDQDCHVTKNVDIYYGALLSTLPTTRTLAVNDVEGSTAPYHCHDDMTTPCNQDEVLAKALGY